MTPTVCLQLRLLVALVVEDEAGRQAVLSCPTDREALASRRFVEVAAQHYPEVSPWLPTHGSHECWGSWFEGAAGVRWGRSDMLTYA